MFTWAKEVMKTRSRILCKYLEQYFGPSRIGFSLGHVLGLGGNWAFDEVLTLNKDGGTC